MSKRLNEDWEKIREVVISTLVAMNNPLREIDGKIRETVHFAKFTIYSHETSQETTVNISKELLKDLYEKLQGIK